MALTAGLADRAVSDPVGERSRVTRALAFLPLGFMAAIVLVTYAAIVWTLRRGFDWTDEAFVFTLTASNRMATGEAWGFQHLLYPLYVLTGESVLAFRILRLLGYVVLSIALVGCARAVLRRVGVSIPRSGWAFVLLLAQVGTFLAWSYPPRYVGYNELASWFAQLGVALIVLSLAWGVSSPPGGHQTESCRRGSRTLWSIWVGLGVLITLLVFAKVTSAVLFVAILALAVVIPNPHLRLWKRVVSLGGGATAALLVLWVLGCPVGFYFKNAYSLVFDKSARDGFGRPFSPMISSYTESVIFTGRALLPALLIFALAMGSFHSKVRAIGGGAKGDAIDRVTWVLGVLLFIALIALPKAGVWSYLGVLVVFVGAAGTIGLAVLGADRARIRGWRAMPPTRWSRRSISLAIGSIAIAAAPFIGALGTSNPIIGQLMWAASLWAVLLGIALVLLAQRAAQFRSSARSLPILIGCTVTVLAALAVNAHIAAPYRSLPLLSLETSTSVPELRGILLTEADAAWIDWVSAAGASLGADDVPAIAVNTRVGDVMNTSGALYAFNHSGYANPWLGIRWPAASNSLSAACKGHRPADLFVLQPGTSANDSPAIRDVANRLGACGMKFPGDFRVVGERADADPAFAMTIWRLKNGRRD